MPDLDHEDDTLFVDVGRDVRGAVQVCHAMEDTRPVDRRQEVMRSGIARLIEHGVWHAGQVIRGGISKDEALENRRQEQTAPILEHGEELFAGQREYAVQCREHGSPSQASVLRVRTLANSRSSAAMVASTAASGSTIPHTLPARKIVCRSVT